MPDRVEHDHRLVVHTQITGGPGFEEFLQGADAARQREEGVGSVLHHLLTLPHGVDDDEFVGVDVGDFAMHQRLRDDADGVSASCPCSASHRTHGRDVAAARHQRPAARRDRLPDVLGQGHQLRMRRPRRAVDTHRPLAAGISGHTDNLIHGFGAETCAESARKCAEIALDSGGAR